MNTVLLIDGTNQFIRNYVTFSTSTSNGDPFGGVVGFLRSLSGFVGLTKPQRVVVVFDAPGGSKRRKQIYKEYKANRKPPRHLNRHYELTEKQEIENKQWQLRQLVEYLEDLPVSIVIVKDIEADDAIAYIAQHFPDEKKVIVSSDRDFYQLIDDKTTVYKPTQRVFYDADQCVKEFGVHPCNFATARAVIGDSSDNIKGVRGVGFKTLVKMFPQLADPKGFSLDQLLAFCEQNDDARYSKIAESKKSVVDNYSIMSLAVPLISVLSIKKIKSCIKTAPSVNNTALRLKIMRDGIDLGGNFFPNFLTLSVAGKNANR